MTKRTKKRQRAMDATLAFDEASSGSDDSDSDDGTSSSVLSKASEVDDERKIATVDDDDSLSSDGDSSDSDSGSPESENESNNNTDDEELRKNKNGENLRKELSESDDEGSDEDLPLHERVRRKEEKGLSMRKIRERKSRALEVASQRLAKLKQSKRGESVEIQLSKKKKSKHAPTEVSSKRSDYFKRGAPKLNESGIGIEIGAHKYKPLDPRTSNLSGHLNEEQFEKNYSFIEGIRNKEIAQLKKQIVARKVTGKKGQKKRRRLNISGGSLEEDQERLKQLLQEKAELKRRQLDRAAKQSVKRKIREDVALGKQGAYFLKRKEQRRLQLEAKLEEIRKRGGDKAVEKALAKKRQKNKSRDAGFFAK